VEAIPLDAESITGDTVCFQRLLIVTSFSSGSSSHQTPFTRPVRHVLLAI